MSKRIVVVGFVLTLIFNLCLFVGCSKNSAKSENENKDSYVVRGQWVTMLAETFNLDTYQETTPYYTDIDSNSELFPYVQSSKEWDVLSIYQGETFDAETPVTRREVASTAAIAAGFRAEESSFDPKGQFIEEPSVNYAMKHNIVENKELSDRMTSEECEAVLENAKNIYLNGDGEEKISVKYNENIVDLKKVRPNFIDVDETEHTVTFLNDVLASVVQDDTGTMIASIQTMDKTVDVREGDVFITLPIQGQRAGIAYKILSMEENDRGVTFQVKTPTLGDLYDELVYHTTISLDESHITWADGVTVSPVSSNDLLQNGQANEFHIELLSNRSEEYYSNNQAVEIDDLTYYKNWNIKMGNEAVKATEKDKIEQDILAFSSALEKLDFSNFKIDHKPSVSDFIKPTESWTKSLPKEEKYAKGYKIEGNLSLNLKVTPDIEYNKLLFLDYPESASLTVESSIGTDLSIEGSLSEEYTIATICIPTAIEGLTIDGTLSLCMDLNGSVQAKLEFQNKNRVDWKAPIDFRRAEDSRNFHKEVQALVDLSIGPNVSLDLRAFSINIIGTDLNVSGNVSATGTLEGKCTERIEGGTTTKNYTESIRLQSDIYLPIISLTARGPDFLADNFDIKKEWEIIGKDKAAHFTLSNYTHPLWEATVILNSSGEIIEEEESTSFSKALTSFQNGDFSSIAGTYTANMEYAPYYGFSSCPDIELAKDGTVTGGGFTSYGYTQKFAAIPPTSVNAGDDTWGNGTLVCTIENIPGNPIQEDGVEYEVIGGHNETYIVYPPGVSAFDGAFTEDLNKVRIRYVIIDGGVEDMIYTKID